MGKYLDMQLHSFPLLDELLLQTTNSVKKRICHDWFQFNDHSSFKCVYIRPILRHTLSVFITLYATRVQDFFLLLHSEKE